VFGGGRLNVSPERGVPATEENDEPVIIAVRELDLERSPALEGTDDIMVLEVENVDDVPVFKPLFRVVPVR
jgi:hypothetical protein